MVAAGTPPFAYQWQFNSTNLNGATSSALTLISVQPANAGTYSVTVTNAYGSTTSSNAALIVNIPPSITTQPASQTMAAGYNATFSVMAVGDPTLNYQWQFNGVIISGATTTSLTVANVQLANEGSYSVTVNNPYASTTSSNASLSVNLAGCSPPPSGLVSWWPGNGSAADLAGSNNGALRGNVSYVAGEVGQAFSFNGNGAGVVIGNPVSLQLQNFTIDAWIERGSTNLASYAPTGGGEIFVYGAGGYGLGVDNNGQLYLTQVDASQVVSSAVVTDTNWHHVAVTKGGSAVVFYVDGVGYPAAAFNPTFTFTSSAAIGMLVDNGGNTFLGLIDEVDVFNRALAASEVQAIYNAGSAGKCGVGGSPPSITNQPTSQTVTAGGGAAFSVGASGTPVLNYQWSFNGTNLGGATTSTLTLTNAQLANMGNYMVTVTNAYGPATSSNASLIVNAPLPSPVSPPTRTWWRAPPRSSLSQPPVPCP